MSEVSDIGEIPLVANPERREACRLDLLKFLVTYFPESTGLKPFADDHRRMIARIESCCLHGGRYANAMYRGGAKTTITENSAIWTVMYGHRKFVPIFGADADAATENIDSIKMELSENDLLYEDFPEVCHAIRALEGKPQRQHSQHRAGELTHIGWTADTVVLPSIRLPRGWATGKPEEGGELAWSAASGVRITTSGLLGSPRGMKHKRPDGTQQRPDFVLIDDPQTDESATTDAQIAKRMNKIKKAILRLGGHDKQMAVVMNATVIRAGDIIDQLLDQSLNPSWQGERVAMVRQWPAARETLWREYATIRNDYDPDVLGDQIRSRAAATDFYRASREEMDAGAEVSWEHCYEVGVELSALQHAFNILIDDGPDVFASECQNQPLAPAATDDLPLATSIDIANRCNGLDRGIAPAGTRHITAFVDVGETLLHWLVVAWTDDFSGYVLDYGAYPDQGKLRFTSRGAERTIRTASKAKTIGGAILDGLNAVDAMLLGREWAREDGTMLRIGKILKDSGYEPDLVNEQCRRSPFAAITMPSRGLGIGPSERPLSERSVKEGDQAGRDWLITSAKKRGTRYVQIDANSWKSFVHRRLLTAMGDPGAITLFGNESGRHQLLAEHLAAETCTRTEGRGRTVYVWRHPPPKRDNHWLDCLVGCAAAASMLGLTLTGTHSPTRRKMLTRQDLEARVAAKRAARLAG